MSSSKMKQAERRFWDVLRTIPLQVRNRIESVKRLRAGDAFSEKHACPVCAVFNKVFPRRTKQWLDYESAGKALGLSLGVYQNIAHAADAYTPITVRAAAYRKKMLRMIKENG